MSSSVNSPADVINIALAILGHPGRVGNLYDGSDVSRKALDIFAESRDEVMRAKDWPFALRQVSGAAAVSTVSGWLHSWTYPADCLRVRSVAPASIPSPNYDPQPVQWTIFNDVSQSPPIRVILSNINPVNINYVGQVTDMATWEPLFVNAVAQVIATKLAPNVVKKIAPALDALGAITEAAMADEMQAPDDAVIIGGAPSRQPTRGTEQ